MRYKDDLEKGWVNGYFVGLRQGTNTQDALEEESDGYEAQRNAVRFGTVTQDAKEPNFPEPWEYTITYEAGHEDATGDAPTEDDTAEGKTITIAENTFTLTGYTFVGWKDQDGNVYNPGDTLRVGNKDIILTAQWEVDSDG